MTLAPPTLGPSIGQSTEQPRIVQSRALVDSLADGATGIHPGLSVRISNRLCLTSVGRALTAYDMPIEGRDEWLAATRRLA